MFKSSDQHIRNFLTANRPLVYGSISSLLQESSELKGLDEPTFLGFTLKFDFYREASMSNQTGSGDGVFGIPNTTTSLQGLLLPQNDIDSAINYLRRVNKPYLSEMIVEFQEQLKYLQDNKPWYFSTISGAGDLIKIPPPGQTWRGKDKILTIDCLESLDMQMTFIADLYRKFHYDMYYKRFNLPIDKRRFNCKLIVSEIRNLRTVGSAIEEGNKILQSAGISSGLENSSDIAAGASNLGPDASSGSLFDDILNKASGLADKQIASLLDITTTLDENLTFLVFFLYNCEFVFDEYSYLETLSNATVPDPASFRFKIKIGDIIEDNQYGYWKWLLSDTKYSASPNQKMKIFLESFNTRKLNWYDLVRRSSGADNLYKSALQGLDSAIQSIKNNASTILDDLAKYYGRMTGDIDAIKQSGNEMDYNKVLELKAKASFQIYKNIYGDLTQGQLGNHKKILLPGETLGNVYEPLDAQISIKNKKTERDLLFEAIRKEKESEIPTVEHKNVGGGYERSDEQIARDKKVYNQKNFNGEHKTWKDAVFINVEVETPKKQTEINSGLKTYTTNEIKETFKNINSDEKIKSKGTINPID